eukprot:Skav206754  [mRNA]  locus=scaffold167:59436:71363:- [translate_table: standard]
MARRKPLSPSWGPDEEPGPRKRRRRRRGSQRGSEPRGFPPGSRSPSNYGGSRSPSNYGGGMKSRGWSGGRSPPRRRRRRRSPRASQERSRYRRPWIEKEKGGVKLFVGRLPREVNKAQLEECFGEYGEVLEVFIIASQAASGVGCAFVRMASPGTLVK